MQKKCLIVLYRRNDYVFFFLFFFWNEFDENLCVLKEIKQFSETSLRISFRYQIGKKDKEEK